LTKRVIAIVGPKGGVGKSNIAANLAIALAQMGRKVTAVDLDLGGANLHIILGIRDFKVSLDDFVLKKVKNLKDVTIDTGIKNLDVICGGSKIPDIANMPFQQKIKLISHLLKLESDVIIMDLAAGSSFNVVDFLFIADKGLLVTTPELTSLMKVYGFIKASVFRMLSFHFKSENTGQLMALLEKAKDFDANPQLNTIDCLLAEADKINPEYVISAKEKLARFIPNVVINMVKSPREGQVGGVIQNLLKHYLSIECNIIAAIPEDAAVRKALNMLKPVMTTEPDSEFAKALRRLAGNCI
jgi:flagellar biosynthesis protein FlhG